VEVSTPITVNGAEHGSAWVESPLQLLPVTEPHSAGLLLDVGRILLGPGLRGPAETAAELRADPSTDAAPYVREADLGR